jgi:RNA polymerase sigma factor (sigma-70 family)
MKAASGIAWMPQEQDRRIAETLAREEGRLRAFIRRRVADAGEAEDVLQDVFYELVLAYRLMKPIEHVTGWLFRVARNRITDLFRRKRPEPLEDVVASGEPGPEMEYARSLLLDALEAALDELPEEQREVFVAHELEGRSFKELSAETGVGVNTLLSRKHYAVLRLRERLRRVQEEFEP